MFITEYFIVHYSSYILKNSCSVFLIYSHDSRGAFNPFLPSGLIQ